MRRRTDKERKAMFAKIAKRERIDYKPLIKRDIKLIKTLKPELKKIAKAYATTATSAFLPPPANALFSGYGIYSDISAGRGVAKSMASYVQYSSEEYKKLRKKYPKMNKADLKRLSHSYAVDKMARTMKRYRRKEKEKAMKI